MGDRVFRGLALATVFGVMLWWVLGSDRRDGLDALIARTRGERVREPLAPSRSGYALEGRGGTRTTIGDVPADRIRFINFFATFCQPCVDELPSLLAMARAHQREVTVVAVSYDDSWEAVQALLGRLAPEGLPTNLQVLRDPGGERGRDLKSLFGTTKLPESYLLRGDIIEAKYAGARDWTSPEFAAVLEALR